MTPKTKIILSVTGGLLLLGGGIAIYYAMRPKKLEEPTPPAGNAGAGNVPSPPNPAGGPNQHSGGVTPPKSIPEPVIVSTGFKIGDNVKAYNATQGMSSDFMPILFISGGGDGKGFYPKGTDVGTVLAVNKNGSKLKIFNDRFPMYRYGVAYPQFWVASRDVKVK